MARYTITVSKKELDDDYLFLEFTKPKGLEFEDGQYGVFLHVNKDVEGRKVRAFSFASSNKEDHLKIATRHTKSSFKMRMAELHIGDKMTVDGPMGNFGLEPRKARVFIAGGIGITPIRSMLYGLESLNDTTLIYSEAREEYPYLEDLEALNGLNLQLASGRPRTSYLIDQATRIHENKAIYYICGSPSFVSGISDQLKQLGITQNNIRFDRFTGY